MERLSHGEQPNPRKRERFDEQITDPGDAEGMIHDLFEQGERPVISIPEQYADAIQHGLVAHSTWIPGFSAIVGTFGREPYVPAGEKRVLVRVNLDEDQIEPRFTGPSHAYQGIVVLKGQIPPEKLSRLN